MFQALYFFLKSRFCNNVTTANKLHVYVFFTILVIVNVLFVTKLLFGMLHKVTLL